jgi:hypothetical protein
MDVRADYIVECEELGALLDPNDGWDEYRKKDREDKGPWVVIRTHGHLLCHIGPALEHIEQRTKGLGRWIAASLHSPFSVSPHGYAGHVGQAFWRGEEDEEEVKLEYGDEYEGPTLAELHQLVPEWARKGDARRNRQTFIANARRILGVDMAPLFKPNGSPRVDWSDTWRGMWYERWFPALFPWKRNDLVTAAIDEIGDINGNCGSQSEAAAVFYAGHDLKRGETSLSDAWAVLEVFDKFAVAINAYSKKHKLV